MLCGGFCIPPTISIFITAMTTASTTYFSQTSKIGMASPELALYALSQRAHHLRCLSQLNPILLETTPEETNAPSRCPQRESKTPPLPATPYTSLLCRAPRSTSIGPKKGMEKQAAAKTRLDNLYTNQYDPIGVGLDPELLSGSNHRAGAGLSLPFPPQSKISDLDSLFNRKTNRSGTLHILSGGDLDGGAYGYDPPLLRRDLPYANTSTSLSSLLEVGSNTGPGTRNSLSPNDSPEQGFRCQ